MARTKMKARAVPSFVNVCCVFAFWLLGGFFSGCLPVGDANFACLGPVAIYGFAMPKASGWVPNFGVHPRGLSVRIENLVFVMLGCLCCLCFLGG